jgi:hypothetical protein
MHVQVDDNFVHEASFLLVPPSAAVVYFTNSIAGDGDASRLKLSS